MAAKKIYTVIKTHNDREREVSGTLDELIEYFSYTLECGHGWNSRIPRYPKTIKSLISALNKSFYTIGKYWDCVELKS